MPHNTELIAHKADKMPAICAIALSPGMASRATVALDICGEFRNDRMLAMLTRQVLLPSKRKIVRDSYVRKQCSLTSRLVSVHSLHKDFRNALQRRVFTPL